MQGTLNQLHIERYYPQNRYEIDSSLKDFLLVSIAWSTILECMCDLTALQLCNIKADNIEIIFRSFPGLSSVRRKLFPRADSMELSQFDPLLLEVVNTF